MDVILTIAYVLCFIAVSGSSSKLLITSKKSNHHDRIIHHRHRRIFLYGLCAYQTRKILTIIKSNTNEY